MIELVAAATDFSFGPGNTFPAVDQQYLLEARQMQALSFAMHIPLVCFGVAFPAMVILMEWLGLRTGKAHYTEIARRWSKVMITLFAAGVVTGTLLSFELGILWSAWMHSPSGFELVTGRGRAASCRSSPGAVAAPSSRSW